jgi:glycosyltransferase involved in cell wall biosynthesis
MLASRAAGLARSYGADVTLLQREMMSTYLTLELLTKRPRVLDVDDAIWLRRGGHFARRLGESCDVVICGNGFLAEHFQKWNRRVTVLPTAVDTDRFRPAAGERHRPDRQVICWSGTSGGYAYLDPLEQPLADVLAKYPQSRLRIVSDRPPAFRRIPPERVEYVRWRPEKEVEVLQTADVCIMPLDDSPWSRGKCAYKMLTYMACGCPVVVSAVGMNAEVLAKGTVGLGAQTNSEWVEALSYLLAHPDDASVLGQNGRQVVLREYSLDALAPLLAKILAGSHS